MPVLTSAGYTEKVSLGLITGTGSLGMLLPRGQWRAVVCSGGIEQFPERTRRDFAWQMHGSFDQLTVEQRV